MDGERRAESIASEMILPLTSAEATLASAGGKGMNLAALARAGFAVPPGFIVTTDAYRAFVAANGFGARLADLSSAASPDDLAALESTSAAIRALFASGSMPALIESQILVAYDELSRPLREPAAFSSGDAESAESPDSSFRVSAPPRETPVFGPLEGSMPVAVRSSATAEDLPGLSFAGQQDTYLNVVGPEAVIAAVKSCWSSLWTARAIGYRARNHISSADVALAVVVQQMIPAEVSGVIFTANPLTGHRGEMVVDASFGLGEAIVSGQVEPDHYVVSAHDGVPRPSQSPLPSRACPRPDRGERARVRVVSPTNQQFSIISRKLGAKALAIRPLEAGGTETITRNGGNEQALSDPRILELAAVAARVAALFGSPQDIEWAWADGSDGKARPRPDRGAKRLYVLQSRPITSLNPVPEWLLASKDLRILFSFNSLQGFIEPFTPLGLGIFPLITTNLFRRIGVRGPIQKVAIPTGGRVYVDITVPLGDRRLRRPVLGFLGFADPGAREAALGLIAAGRIPLQTNLRRRDLLRLVIALRPVITGLLRGWLWPEASRPRAIQKADEYIAQFRQAMTAAAPTEWWDQNAQAIIPVTGTASPHRSPEDSLDAHQAVIPAASGNPGPALGRRGFSYSTGARLGMDYSREIGLDEVKASLRARLAVIDRYIPELLQKLFFTMVPVMAPAMMGIGLLNSWLLKWAGAEPLAAQRLLRGVSGNPTTQMDLKLWAAAEAIRADSVSRAALATRSAIDLAAAYHRGELPPTAQRALQAFLDEYGMRGVGEIDVGRPRWREDPRSIIQNLASFLQIDDPEMAPDRLFAKAGAEAERLAAEYIVQTRQRSGRLRAFLVGFAIRRLRLLGGMREMPKFYMVKAFDLVRTALLDSGRELAALGELDAAEDIFFVPLETLRTFAAGGPSSATASLRPPLPEGEGWGEGALLTGEAEPIDLRSIVLHNRAEYERELARRQMPRLLLSTGEVFYDGVSSAGKDELVGDGVSPGIVEGPVRVVLDPRAARLAPGEILVCPATDPGWTPLFLSAGGLVMELGGMMTHGSVVAREYGIPAVVGVQEATRRLKDGQRIRVDGSAGRVVVLEPDSA